MTKLTALGQVENHPIPLDSLHRFHPYCARFPSEIAVDAVNQLTAKGDSVCDPFCGSGTSLVAGLLQGRKVVGSDIDALAGILTRLKCLPRSAQQYQPWRRDFAERV